MKRQVNLLIVLVIFSMSIALVIKDNSDKKKVNAQIQEQVVIVATPIPTLEPTPTPKPNYIISDIPLSEDLQTYIYDQCQENGLNYFEVLALIKVESSYNPNLISETHDYGLMQINRCNIKELKESLGIRDILNPYENVKAGIYMLSKYGNLKRHHRLMAYNMGARKANELVSRGIGSSRYSRKVVSEMEGLEQ